MGLGGLCLAFFATQSGLLDATSAREAEHRVHDAEHRHHNRMRIGAAFQASTRLSLLLANAETGRVELGRLLQAADRVWASLGHEGHCHVCFACEPHEPECGD